MAEIGWNLEAPPGFQGLRPDKPLTVYYRHRPTPFSRFKAAGKNLAKLEAAFVGGDQRPSRAIGHVLAGRKL